MSFSNIDVARKLREVAAAYTLKKGQNNLFQIRAYENAAAAVEHLTSEIKDLWEEGKLDEIPSIGESLKEYLGELLKTGKVKHWEAVKRGIPSVIFGLLDVPGIGPKTALKVAKLGIKSLDDLKHQLEDGSLVKRGFSQKLAENISQGLKQRETAKTGRMLLPYAFTQAEKVLAYLKKCPEIEKVDALGSLRRMTTTVGDLDFAIASSNPSEAIECITKMPGIARITEKGETQATVLLSSGVQLDFLITKPESYGALLQHFTGSKAHNIHLRTLAQEKNLSLSEHGIKEVKSPQVKIYEFDDEGKFYNFLGLDWIPPELREDSGEIEASLKKQLPCLIEPTDIKGDLHIHSNYPLEPSHDLGANSPEEIIQKAKSLKYAYIGISDHQPSISQHSQEQIIKILQERLKLIEQINYSQKDIRVLNLLEVDILPDGSLGVPNEGLKLLDFAIAGIHSVHHQSQQKITQRILRALENPYVKVLAHPTNRLLNEREASDADWPMIFKFVAKQNKALEINAFPNRLDLPDTLIREAKSYGVKFVINTDSHEIEQMENIRFGVATARRGWATKEDIINTWDWTDFREWFKLTI